MFVIFMKKMILTFRNAEQALPCQSERRNDRKVILQHQKPNMNHSAPAHHEQVKYLRVCLNS